MAFINERFPIAISDGAHGGPGFQTDIATSNSGAESRNEIWTQELGRWEVAHNAKLPAQYEPLQAFFRVMRGRANSFRFRDWMDYKCTTGVFVMLTSTTFQCYKRYTFGGSHYDRKIWLPVSPIVVTGGTVSSVSYTTGIVTMASGTPTAWTGQFDCLARFDVDGMAVTQVDHQFDGTLIITWTAIPIFELRQP